MSLEFACDGSADFDNGQTEAIMESIILCVSIGGAAVYLLLKLCLPSQKKPTRQDVCVGCKTTDSGVDR